MSNYNNILLLVNQVIKQIRQNKYLRIFSKSLAALSSFLFLVVTVEVVFRFGTETRFLLYSLGLLAFSIFIGMNLVILLSAKFSHFGKDEIKKASLLIGEKYNDIKDQLLNAIQLFEDKESKYSHELIDASIESVYKNLDKKDLTKVINKSKTTKLLRYSILFTVIISSVLYFVNPFNNSILRIVNYNKSFEEPLRFTFEVSPGNKRITKGTDIDFRINVKGDRLDKIFFLTKESDDAYFNSVPLLVDSNNQVQYQLKDVNRSFNYFVEAENIKSNDYKIEVINRPSINSLNVEVTPPSYSKLPKDFLNDNGNIRALKGSRASFNIAANKELKSAQIIFLVFFKKKIFLLTVRMQI